MRLSRDDPPIAMNTYSSISETRAAVRDLGRRGQTVGFVPTMGALHFGHRSLIEAARGRCDAVVVSIFVNPTQFSPGEDFDSYPRPVEDDLAVCREMGVDLVFLPSVETMYPPAAMTRISVGGLTENLCGAHRPGHFDGVTTVVAKLFNIVPATAAFFGEKDYQQLKVLERMVRDLDIPIEIVPCPTLREPDGLAISSRNAYLTDTQRLQATSLSRAMRCAQEAFSTGERDAARLIALMESELHRAGPVSIDYVSIVDVATLENVETLIAPARICIAARIGSCRLIDNMPLGAP